MTDNPFRSPSSDDNPYAERAFSPSEQNRVHAQAQVNGPAMALMIVSGIFIGLILVGMIVTIAMLVSGAAAQLDQNGPISRESIMGIRVGFGILLIIVNGFIFMAAMKMKSLEGYTQARVASILALVPCIGPCYILGIPFGIWALVVLGKPEIRDAFRS